MPQCASSGDDVELLLHAKKGSEWRSLDALDERRLHAFAEAWALT
jgi:hypothetical protein